MFKILLGFGLVVLVVMVVLTNACTKPAIGSLEQSRQVAIDFTKMEATYRFDGIPDTLKVTSTTSVADGWKFTIDYDSAHAGYGNRTGQMLAQVITHHVAEVTVKSGKVISAVMDGRWDMMGGRMMGV